MAEFRTRRGIIRSALVVSIALLAGMAALLSGLSTTPKIVLALAVAAAAIASLLRAPVHRISLPQAGLARMDGRAGTLSASAVSSLYVALVLETPAGKRHRVGIFRDELTAEQFRALLACIRNG